MSAFTNNLSNTISNYNIQKNNINLLENEHKENLSKTIVSSDADALTTKGINTSKHNICYNQTISETITLINNDCANLYNMSNSENSCIENSASQIENSKKENFDYNIQKNHNNEGHLTYDIYDQSNIVEKINNAYLYNTNMFSNPLCKMSDQIHQKKEIMKPNDEVSIQNLHKDDYVDIINKKRSINKLNNKLLTIKKKHITDLNKMIAAKITNQN
ncbi:hypothetical protein COBT_004033, partial [Conglomerata obtusa]